MTSTEQMRPVDKPKSLSFYDSPEVKNINIKAQAKRIPI